MADGIVWITSGTDSHSSGKHPTGDALDFRAKNIAAESLSARRELLMGWANGVQRRVGDDFDIVPETHSDSNRDHLHCEFDPD